jgi:hypothetical protein
MLSVYLLSGLEMKNIASSQWRTEGRGFGVFKPPPPEISNALQNGAKLNPIVKTVKNC